MKKELPPAPLIQMLKTLTILSSLACAAASPADLSTSSNPLVEVKFEEAPCCQSPCVAPEVKYYSVDHGFGKTLPFSFYTAFLHCFPKWTLNISQPCSLNLFIFFSSFVGHHPFCGETCLDPKKFGIYHIFEKNLTRADGENPCASQFTQDGGFYSQYNSTVTHGLPHVLSVTLDLYQEPGTL